jgi:uncharacterized protein (TIGR02145 family)
LLQRFFEQLTAILKSIEVHLPVRRSKMENARHAVCVLSAVIVLSLSCKEKTSTGPITSGTAPKAYFDVRPDFGTIATEYFFDAWRCRDKQDTVVVLQVRWDWENDGRWDTDYSLAKTATHRFPVAGTKTVCMEVRDTAGLTNTTTRKFRVFIANTPPTATFTITPDSGTTETIFTFDPSGSSDKEDTITALRAKWIGIGSGGSEIWPSVTKKRTEYFSSIGTKTITFIVRDRGDLADTCKKQLTVKMVGGEKGSVMDIDGNTYGTVRINSQWWMTENLNVTHYRNGDAIPTVTDAKSWGQLTTGACCVFDNNENNAVTYGRLYNWYAVDDRRNIAPAGWHVPSDAEWKTLRSYLGSGAGTKMKEAGTAHWRYSGVAGTDAVGFSALAGGFRYESGYYGGIYIYANFWSSTESVYDNQDAVHYLLTYSSSSADCYYDGHKYYGFSVRCVGN